MRNIYTSIDIGTDTIKVIVCELFNGKINLLASSSTKSKGIKRGFVIDIEEAATTLKMALTEVETKLGIKIRDVITIIPSYNLSFSLISGAVEIQNEDNIVTTDDIVKVLQQGLEIEENMEMVTILPVSFMLDKETITNAPRGKQAKRLDSKAILVTTPSKNIYNIMRLMNKCELEVLDISISGICDMCALRNSTLDNKVGVIINIGSDITNISLYNKGIIINSGSVEIGGKAIDNDISYIYKTSIYDAQKIKEKFAIASLKHASIGDIYDLLTEDGKIVKVNQQEITEIVSARLDEILRTVKKELVGLTSKHLDYILFTGGMSNIPYFEYMAEEIFGPLARVAKINIVGVRNNKYTSSLGNIVYYINKQRLKGEYTSMIDDENIENLTSLKRNIINVSNESMLGKLTQYFFGE